MPGSSLQNAVFTMPQLGWTMQDCMQPQLSNPPEKSCSDDIGGVSLVLVVLDDNALLEQRGVISIVLIAVVGMEGMCHVSTDQEAALNGTLHCALLALRQDTGYPMDGVFHHRTPSSCKTGVTGHKRQLLADAC